jgi:hypothetical protein
LDLAALIGLQFRPGPKHFVRWRGQRYPLEYAPVEFELSDGSETWRWPAVIGFSEAPIRYPLLGVAGSLEFMDVTFRGGEKELTIEANALYPGSTG